MVQLLLKKVSRKRYYIIFTSILILHFCLFTDCSKEKSSTNVVDIFSVEINSDSTSYSLVQYQLNTDTLVYNLGQPVKIVFQITTSFVFDETFVYTFQFTTQEQFGVNIYRDSILIFHHPKNLTFESSGFELYTLGERKTFTFRWDQTDDFGQQVAPGEYLIETFLLEENSPVRKATIEILDTKKF